MELTHASFFSGVGGLDLGLERAGWRTVSFSEIDPYASAVLAERWPEIPNLGDITAVAATTSAGLGSGSERGRNLTGSRGLYGRSDGHSGRDVWHSATLWSGGFPCQDLSVAGKRRGMGTEDDRTRSGLAYAFLDLVERHRPPAILLENVPGLLSSNGGKDFGALLSRLGQLGYWWAYRILDAQFFGVPQRRRRVFVVALHAGAGFGADSAAAVLSVGSRCDGHSQAGDEAREGTSGVLADGATSTVQSAFGHHGYTLGAQDADGGYLQVGYARNGFGDYQLGLGNITARDYEDQSHLVSTSPDPGGVREADGMARWLDHSHGLERALSAGLGLLPLGLDSHRYRCCGNGVVSNVSEWVGVRLAGMVAA